MVRVGEQHAAAGKAIIGVVDEDDHSAVARQVLYEGRAERAGVTAAR
ncbi:hypothetical protein ACFWIN_29280 [Streptomyces sp. NPDC127049]